MSIKEVAQFAGVSTATVSRVINNHPDVSAQTVQVVKEAMGRLDYRPRSNRPGPKTGARAMQGIKTGNIGLIIVGRTLDLLNHPLMMRTVAYLNAAARERGLHIVLDEMLTPDADCGVIDDGKVDGVLVLAMPSVAHKVLKRLAGQVPVVHMTGHDSVCVLVDHVTLDNEAVGAMAADYFDGLGYQHLAFINEEPKHTSFLARSRAFSDLSRMLGQTVNNFVVDNEDPVVMDSWSGSVKVRNLAHAIELLAKSNPRPTGLFLPCDDIAPEIYTHLRQQGLEPGRDIQVLVCDNDDSFVGQLDPRPSAIDLRTEQVVRRSLARLVNRIAKPGDDPVRVLVQPRLAENGVLHDPDALKYNRASGSGREK